MGRIIYNYYLDCNEYDDDVKESLDTLNPPNDKQYLKRFSEPIEGKEFSFEKDMGYKPYDFTYEDHVH